MENNYDSWDIEILNKIDNGIKLSASEISILLDEENDYVEAYYPRSSDGNILSFVSFIKLCDKYFCTLWQRDIQRDKDIYPNKFIEVVKKQYEEVVEFIEWARKDNEKTIWKYELL